MPTSAPRSHLFTLLLLVAPAGCGDDGSTTSGATTSGATTSGATADDASSTTSPGSTSTASEPTTSTGATPDTDDASTTAGTTGGGEALPPTDSAELLEQWLTDGSYKEWPGESQIHASAGPHGGNVRTYVNLALEQSLAGAAAMHPQGAATVKELYGGGTDTIIGYAVMVKLAPDSANGDGWYWYERLNATVYADGTGVGLCTTCHVGGTDYILTPYPLQ